MNLSDFSKVVKECRKKESPRMIYNASIDHARELFVNLIEEAEERKEDIRIVTGDVTPAFYSTLTEVIAKALDEKLKVKLVVLNPDVDLAQNHFVNVLLNKGGEVYKAQKRIEVPHCILVGDRRFRLELDHAQTKAVASFNNPEIGATLRDSFEEIVNSSAVQRQSGSLS